ncbi:receptor-like protein kinase ANXUR2, partial [Trifolium medium]|nr:receptor-like protein kinase ANXUR2 [Trifolium medium]
MALLGKWCWRLLMDKGCLWFRVLAARYGIERGRFKEGEGEGLRGGGRLCLFDLAENKSSTVAEMSSLGWKAGGEAWAWRRQLWVWEEEMLGECQTLLLNISLQTQSSDKWQWQPDPKK